MTSNRLPEIAKKSERLLVDLEQAVRSFAHYHKYTPGADVRTKAMLVVRLCHRTWRDRNKQMQWVSDLIWAIDELKLTIQLASQLHAFKSFGQFEHIIRQTE